MSDSKVTAQAIIDHWCSHHYGDNLNSFVGIECTFCNESARAEGFELPTTLTHDTGCVVLIAQRILDECA